MRSHWISIKDQSNLIFCPQEMPEAIVAKQKRLEAAERDLKEREVSATTRRDVEEIERVRRDKDKEFEDFLSEVKGRVRMLVQEKGVEKQLQVRRKHRNRIEIHGKV